MLLNGCAVKCFLCDLCVYTAQQLFDRQKKVFCEDTDGKQFIIYLD